MAKRIGTQGTAPFVIQDTGIPSPAGHSDHNVGGPFHVATLADLKAIPSYYLIDKSVEGVERPVWGAMGYVHSDETPENNGRWELKKGLVDNDITNPDNWQKMQTEGGTSETPESIKTKYESNEDTNAFTDAEKLKLAGLQNETGQTIANKYEAHEDVKRFTTALKAKVDGIETSGDGTKFKANDGTYKNIDALPSQTGNAGKVLKTNGTAASWEGLETSDINSLDTKLAGKESITNKGVAGGYAPLDASGMLPASMIPESVKSGVTYKGLWDATSGTPPHISPENGWYWRVSVPGTTDVDGNDEWELSDWIIWNGTAWDRIKNSDRITSVQGATSGDVVITDANVDHQIGITIPSWITAIYTAGKANIRSVFDAIVNQITIMKAKLDGIESGATKNATDANLRNRATHTGKDPIESIEGAEEADINTVVAKKNDGTYGWVNYSEPKPAGIRKADGSIIYYDTLQQAMIASYADYEENDYDIFEIYADTEVDYQIYIDGNRVLNLNGYSLHSIFSGDAILINGENVSRKDKIINGTTISGTTENNLIKIDTLYSGVKIFATIEAENGSGIESSLSFVLYGNITAKNTPIFSFQEPETVVYGNVLSRESYGVDTLEGVIYGNVVTESVDYPAIRTNTLTSKLTVYGSVIIQNESSEAPAILFNDYQPGGAQTIEVEVSGSVIPAQGYAAAAHTGISHNLILTFLGMQSYAGSIEETTKPIIVNAKVPFPELGNDGIQDIIEGTNVNIDKTDPKKPVINFTGGDGSGYETPEEVRDALQSLTEENRLSASAVKGLPIGVTSSEKSKIEKLPDDTNQEIDDINNDLLMFGQDIGNLEDEVEKLNTEHTYVLRFSENLAYPYQYNFQEADDLQIAQITPQGDQVVTLIEHDIDETILKYTPIPMTISKAGIVKLKVKFV